jgi:ammonia channel protein AmtB
MDETVETISRHFGVDGIIGSISTDVAVLRKMAANSGSKGVLNGATTWYQRVILLLLLIVAALVGVASLG